MTLTNDPESMRAAIKELFGFSDSVTPLVDPTSAPAATRALPER